MERWPRHLMDDWRARTGWRFCYSVVTSCCSSFDCTLEIEARYGASGVLSAWCGGAHFSCGRWCSEPHCSASARKTGRGASVAGAPAAPSETMSFDETSICARSETTEARSVYPTLISETMSSSSAREMCPSNFARFARRKPTLTGVMHATGQT